MAVKAPASEPAAPSEKMSPIAPAESPSSRTANTRKIENATLEKKFEVAVHPACARRFGFPRTKRSPSLSSVHRLGFLPVDGRRPRAGLLGLADTEQEQTRADEADGVEEHGVRGGEELDEHAAEPRAADLRGRAADLELRVAVDDLLALDERRQVRLVRDVEEDLERARRGTRRRRAAPSVSASAKYAIGIGREERGAAEVARRSGSVAAAAGRPTRLPAA